LVTRFVGEAAAKWTEIAAEEAEEADEESAEEADALGGHG